MTDDARRLPVILLVARRELLVRLRSRIFPVATVAMVAVVVAGIAAASLLNTRPTPASAVQVGFSGAARALETSFQSVAAALGETVTVTDLSDPGAGRSRIAEGTLDMAVSGSPTMPTALVSDSIPGMVQIALDAATQEARMVAAGLSPSAVTSIMAGVPFEVVQRAGAPAPVLDQSVIAALVVAILLFVAIEIYGIQVAQGVVEEKATRIMEILLATVRPADLLGGKILGIGLMGILQMVIVAAAALIAGTVTRTVSIPALELVNVASYLAWFLLGFAFYAGAYATVAVLVSRQEEVQAATAPVTFLIAGAYVLMFFALPDPNAVWVRVISFLPPAAPIFMPMRTAEVGVAAWEVALAMVLMVGAIVAVVRLAGRIYANSAMRTGMRVPLAEALRGVTGGGT